MRKKCSKCEKARLLKLFNKDLRYRLGVKGWCKDCEHAYSKTPQQKKRHKQRWHENMKDPSFREKQRLRSKRKYRNNPKKQKNRDYIRKYGISLKKFERAKKCALCLQKRKLVPDHNHKTGRYRGPLCYRCNLAISQAEKYKGWLKRVDKHLRRR